MSQEEEDLYYDVYAEDEDMLEAEAEEGAGGVVEFEQDSLSSSASSLSNDSDPGQDLLESVYKKLGKGIVTATKKDERKPPPRVVIRDLETLRKLEQFTERHQRLQHEAMTRDFLSFMLYASENDLIYRYRELNHVLQIILGQPGATSMSATEVDELKTMLRPENWDELRPLAGITEWEELERAEGLAWRPCVPRPWKKYEEDAMLLYAISRVEDVRQWFFSGPPVFDVAAVEQFFFRGGVHGAREPVAAMWTRCILGDYGNQGFVYVVQYVYANYGVFLPPGLDEKRRDEKIRWAKQIMPAQREA